MVSDTPPETPVDVSHIDIEGLAKGLNPSQETAFRFDAGAALVLAGAGSGKTTVLIRRIARLLAEGVPAKRILVATFTRRAADDMADRLLALVGPEVLDGIWIGTFHSHALRIVKREWADLYGKEGKFEIADDYWQQRAVRAILGRAGVNDKLPSPPYYQNIKMDRKAALLAVSACKNMGKYAEEAETALAYLYPDWEKPAIVDTARFWRCYEMAKMKEYDVLSKVPCKRLDFDDLLLECWMLLRENASIRTKYEVAFDHVLVDETQDTSDVQWEIARAFARRNGNLFLVGDVGQSIYGFRGCDPRRTVMAFRKAFPNGEIHRLPANYRAHETLVVLANELIAHADLDERYRLEMQPVRKAGPAPEVTRHVDQDSEAAHVVRSLVDRRQNNALDYRDIAILYRTNAYSRGIEDALIACGVPYHITGGTSFYNRKEVRDMISYLQLTVDPHCPAGTEAAKRLLNVASKRHAARTRSLGQGFVKQVEELAERKQWSFYEALCRGGFTTAQDIAVKDFRDQLKEIKASGVTAQVRILAARQTGYDLFVELEDGDLEDDGEGSSRMENLDELIKFASRFHSVEAFLSFCGGQLRKFGESARAMDAVQIMTIHKSKGLEWRLVHVIGFAFLILPHHRCLRYIDGECTADSFDEERRVAYVAVTRAKEWLVMSWPTYHNDKALGPSPFLTEMPTIASQVNEAMAKQLEPESDPNEFDELIDVDALALEFDIDDGSTL
jgi:DNA helicase-2/ATP-dependent DNA helicase PcrA